MTAQIQAPIPPAAAATAGLAVHCGGSTTRHEAGCWAVVVRGGELRILDADKLITAQYPAGSWTIVPGHTALGQ